MREHLATFLETAARLDDGGTGVPRFVQKELRAFLNCGVLARGLIRLHCGACGKDQVTALSCKGRGFCPRCGGRRMTEAAAHLVDHVIPQVPVRQWVLTLPHRLRYRVGYDHDLCKRLLRVLSGELRRYYRSKCGQPAGHAGSVTFIQRFNSGLGLSPHFHLFALDGVFVGDARKLQFAAASAPSKLDVAEIVTAVHARITRLLQRSGEDHDENGDELATDSPALAACYAASVTRRAALGPNQGKRITQLGAHPNAAWIELDQAGHAHYEGLDLHAGTAIAATDRQGLEHALRYGARPAVATERLGLRADGRVKLELKRRYHDGTTHLVFEPLAFIGRLAALVPRPHKNLIIYSGVLAPNAKLRRQVVAYGAAEVTSNGPPRDRPQIAPGSPPRSDRPNYGWADLMRRAFGVDVLQCPDYCAGRLKLLAAVVSPPAIHAILTSLGLPTEAPELRPSRAPTDDYDRA